MQTRHTLHLADARGLPATADESVDLVVTSPPYPMIEMWDAVFGAASPDAARALAAGDGMAAFEAMHRVLDSVWAGCARALRAGGFLCINVGDATRSVAGEFALYPNHARILQACVGLGLTPLPAIIWRKQTNAPNKFMGSGMLPAGAYVTLEHEFVLILRKGGKRTFASAAARAARQESALFWEERNQWFSDVWEFKGERQAVDDSAVGRRSAAFPFELPFRLVAMFSVEADTVLDPFAGTGTTLAAAAALARNSVGYEVDAALHRLAIKRLLHRRDRLNARNRQRLADHAAFVALRQAKENPPRHVNRVYGFPVVTRQERDLRLQEMQTLSRVSDSAVEATHLPLQAIGEVPSATAPARAGKGAAASRERAGVAVEPWT